MQILLKANPKEFKYKYIRKYSYISNTVHFQDILPYM